MDQKRIQLMLGVTLLLLGISSVLGMMLPYFVARDGVNNIFNIWRVLTFVVVVPTSIMVLKDALNKE